ncbi:hypothetical protein A3F66_03960 [candidate division TM6 bacterium RIFCSPHIGHO2_12_FULL_32_22]|nr:MAG: hypothetical protein A3F66_03960 [candidate division TM6 bacterium RIFCSPHIGHO2_12_FULL_32_22]
MKFLQTFFLISICLNTFSSDLEISQDLDPDAHSAEFVQLAHTVCQYRDCNINARAIKGPIVRFHNHNFHIACLHKLTLLSKFNASGEYEVGAEKIYLDRCPHCNQQTNSIRIVDPIDQDISTANCHGWSLGVATLACCPIVSLIAKCCFRRVYTED